MGTDNNKKGGIMELLKALEGVDASTMTDDEMDDFIRKANEILKKKYGNPDGIAELWRTVAPKEGGYKS